MAGLSRPKSTEPFVFKKTQGIILKSTKQLMKQMLHSLPLTALQRKVVIARNEAILMLTLVAIVVRLLRRLKKPSHNDDA